MKGINCAVLIFIGLIIACDQPQPKDWQNTKIIDLTYPFDENAIYWPTAETFKLDMVFKGENPNGFHYEANNYAAAEPGGTQDRKSVV